MTIVVGSPEEQLSEAAGQEMERGDFEAALSAYLTVLETEPHDVATLMNAGMCLMALGEFAAALPYFEDVLTINPNISHAHHNIGLARAYRREHERAIESFTRTVELSAGFFEAYLDIAQSYQSLGKHTEALEWLNKLLERDPQNIHAYNMKGISHSGQNQPDQAIHAYEQALGLTSGVNSILANLVKACMLAHDWDRLERYLEQLSELTARELARGVPVSKTPFTSLLTSQQFDEIREHTASFLRREHLDVHIAPDWRERLAGKRPLRLGYLSGDFRNAVNGHLSYKMFEHHDRKRFEVVGISTHPGDDSIYHRTVQKDVDRYVQLTMTDDMVQVLRSLELDILIDMNGLHELPMLRALAKRVAPLQMLYLGWAGTSATQIYDYLVTDRILTPSEHHRGYSEKLLQLDRCYQVASYEPLVDTAPGRRAHDLPKDGVVYASFFASYKMTRPLFESWLEILNRVPGSVLWTKHTYDESTARLKAYMKGKGVDPERLIPASYVPLEEHMSRLRLADVALDTWPYSGGASTSNMLFAGVPVVAMKGYHYASRMSMSMLTHLGMPELVTKDAKRYVDLAVKLGSDRRFYANIQRRLNTCLAETRMFDPADFVSHLEAKLLELTGNNAVAR